MLQIAGRDLLRDEGIAFGEALEAAEVPTEMIVYNGLPHGFSSFIGIPESAQYYDRLVEFIQKCVSM